MHLFFEFAFLANYKTQQLGFDFSKIWIKI